MVGKQKDFSESDIVRDNHIVTDKSELVHCPTDWQKMGLMETASGYGARLNSGYKISFNGKLYRVYTTIYGNAGSSWFKVKGRKIYVD